MKYLKPKIYSFWTALLLWIAKQPFCYCTEEYQREIFLTPRNFNPHPFEHQLAKTQDPGPVLFPTNPEDEQPSAVNNNKYNIVTLNDPSPNLVDNTYQRVTQKIKYLLNKKYGSRENQIDTQLLNALSQQGAKVLTYPNQEITRNSLQKKNYAFAYKVLDKATGDDFSHQQFRSSKATNGEYRVKLPDGRLQIVSYKADKNGYKADVRYEVDPEGLSQEHYHNPTAQQYVPQSVLPTQIPVRQIVTKGRLSSVNSYEYAAEKHEEQLINPLNNQDVVVLEQGGPTEIPVKYIDISLSQTPRPQYVYSGSLDHRFQGRQFPNVQHYTKDYVHPGYESTTASTPVYRKPIIRYTSTAVPPTVKAHILHNGDNGLYHIPISSTYAPPAAFPGHKNVVNTLKQSPNDELRQTLEQENDLPEGIYIVGKKGKR
ncbi:uncharacterized protein LOC126740184 [Anthonomus grandis grandis]|uniref:uncharacterized protein LOC126740184 n=1 Tax=Anthonomus grandis grandis TaxID=2921223 RepID=UPI0021653510|nr:uncharacterized protein LOC126740184 [Anthonomus grandis grandis]